MRFLCVGVFFCLAAAAYAKPQEVNPVESHGEVSLKETQLDNTEEISGRAAIEARRVSKDKKKGGRKEKKKDKKDGKKKKGGNKKNNKRTNKGKKDKKKRRRIRRMERRRRVEIRKITR